MDEPKTQYVSLHARLKAQSANRFSLKVGDSALDYISVPEGAAETCQREVKMKMSRSLKLMRGALIRTRKLARDMVFWKRVDKEMAEVRKKEEKEAAEALNLGGNNRDLICYFQTKELTDAPEQDASIVGSSDIDLLNLSTMLGLNGILADEMGLGRLFNNRLR
ncbi:DNA helicase INO80 [Tanacetum coccineum]